MKRCQLRLDCKTLVLSILVGVSGTSCFAQIVQLPSYRTFSYSGSTWVPDGGTASLGGSTYSATHQNSVGGGPFASRSSGRTSSATNLSVTARIIDLRALDDAILSANVVTDSSVPDVISANSPAADGGRSFLNSDLSNASYAGTGGPADSALWHKSMAGEQPRETLPTLAEDDVRYFLMRGKEAELAHRIQASRVYYRMAMEAMTPEMLERYHRIVEQRNATPAPAENSLQPSGRRSF